MRGQRIGMVKCEDWELIHYCGGEDARIRYKIIMTIEEWNPALFGEDSFWGFWEDMWGIKALSLTILRTQ